jgi:hypothetical protein
MLSKRRKKGTPCQWKRRKGLKTMVVANCA